MSAVPAFRPAETLHDRNQIIEEYLPLVERIAKHEVSRLPANVELGDLVSVGTIGLMEAMERFDPGKGQFVHFARLRIRGAMRDFLRKNDHVPRSIRRNVRDIAEARNALAEQLGRTATDEEVAAYLGITMKSLEKRVREGEIRRKVSLDAPTTEDGSTLLVDTLGRDDLTAEEDLMEKQRIKQAAYHVSNLPERQRLALSLYYMQGFKLREVGDFLGVTESRACQLIKEAERRLKDRMEPSVF